MPELKPDPHLQAAMEEIKSVLTKYDIAAIVVLSSPKHNEYLYKLDPTWTCIRDERDAEGRMVGIRVNSKEVPKEQKKQVITDSVGTIASFLDITRVTVDRMETMLAMLAKHVEFDHFTREIKPPPFDTEP